MRSNHWIQRGKRAICAAGTLFVALSLYAGGAVAETATISAPLRAAIIKKVISYDKTLSSLSSIKVFIFFGQATSSGAQELQSALERLGVTSVTTSSEEELRRRTNDVQVLYVLADDASNSVRGYCRQAHCLSLTSSMAFVEQGDASVAITALNGKPQLVVHMKRLSEERQDLSAEMLQLARVIR